MFKWLSKIRLWRQTSKAAVVYDYGQYLYKPVIARALSVVLEHSQAEIVAWVADPNIQIYLNDRLIEGANWTRERLESGNYEIKIPSQNKVWRFFIA